MAILPSTMAPSSSASGPGELESLAGRMKKGDGTAIPAMAREFESLMMSQVIKQMRQTLDPETLFGKDPGDVYGGLFDMFMGRHLAQGGGMGLASTMERQLKSTLPASSSGLTSKAHK